MTELLLGEAMLLLNCDVALLPGQVVDLSVSHDPQQALLEIELLMPSDGIVPSDVQERIENRPVWQIATRARTCSMDSGIANGPEDLLRARKKTITLLEHAPSDRLRTRIRWRDQRTRS